MTSGARAARANTLNAYGEQSTEQIIHSAPLLAPAMATGLRIFTAGSLVSFECLSYWQFFPE